MYDFVVYLLAMYNVMKVR